MEHTTFSRRQAFGGLAALVAASTRVAGEESDRTLRLPPRGELVNVFEFEEQAKRILPRAAYSAVAGSNRQAFDRITVRPRMVVNCMNLDLTVELAGDRLFAPILIAPVSKQVDYHPEGELATARGATAAKTAMIVSESASHSIDRIAAEAKTPLWYQLSPTSDLSGARARIGRAVAAGCKGICITVRPLRTPIAAPIDWIAVDQLRNLITVPVLLKGVLTLDDARAATQRHVQGLIVSNGGMRSTPAPIEMLPRIVDAVGPDVPVLADGSFRRGSDMLKALAFGARAVLVGRPVMWGLAAYGAGGVQSVLELLQMDLARMMAGCGKPTIRALDRSAIKVHAPSPKPRA